ncbi:hypothetical protein BDR06DRAFT_360746 [Suillus hirtellus]|nr:hypothetical protein BDR06DRAFT_360746 [Suillus hirtellus]
MPSTCLISVCPMLANAMLPLLFHIQKGALAMPKEDVGFHANRHRSKAQAIQRSVFSRIDECFVSSPRGRHTNRRPRGAPHSSHFTEVLTNSVPLCSGLRRR